MQITNRYVVEVNPSLVITLNVDGLNFPIKRQSLADQIKKKVQHSSNCCQQDIPFRHMDTKRLKLGG